MPLPTNPSTSFSEHDISPLVLDYVEQASKRIIQTAVSEAASTESVSIRPRTPARGSLVNYLCDLHDKLTLRSIMAFLGVYVFLLTFQIIFQLDDKLARRPAPSPRPFFREAATEFIADFYAGNGASPAVLLRRAEIAVVMYYAPWSLESRQARPAFEQVARSFANVSQVSFSAVNCFYARGECRQTYRAHVFPIIVAYLGKTVLMYNGEITADFIHSWVLHLQRPMVRLTGRQEVGKFMAEHDSAVIAYFSINTALKRGSRFRQYLISSLSIAQYDGLLDKVAFAVLTDPVTALYMRFGYESQIRLYHWYRNTDYPYDRNYTGSAITEWVKNLSADPQLVQWIVPDPSNLGKTEQFYLMLNNAPTVIVFTAREPLYEEKSDLSIISQTALEYYSCDEAFAQAHKNRAMKREEFRRQRIAVITRDRSCCNRLNPALFQLFDCCHSSWKSLDWPCHMCYVRDSLYMQSQSSCFRDDPFSRRQHLFQPRAAASCQQTYKYLSDESFLSECCAILSQENELPDQYEDLFAGCEKFKLAQKMRYNRLPDVSLDRTLPFDEDSVAGLSCGRNSTLRFAAVDVRHNDYWLKKLSLPTSYETLVVLVNSKTENIFVMQEPFSRNAFRSFVRQFHANLLDQHQVTETVSKSAFMAPNKSGQVKSDVLIRKTTAAGFELDILNSESNKDVILFFSGGDWHGPSASVFYVYHTVAYYFKRFLGGLQFSMIDVSKNELSWPYKMEKLPAVLFFPAKRKSASTSFPPSVPFTVPNLIAFILAHCQSELRWRVALSSCSQLCIHRNKLRLRRHATVLTSDITVLQRLSETLKCDRHTRLVGALIERRRAQLRVTRKLLSLLRSLNALTSGEIQNEAAAMAKSSISLQSLFEYPFSQGGSV